MRRILAVLSVMALMLLLASGVALALNQVDCATSTDPADGVCYGTTKSDVIVGTEFNDTIYGLAGNDTANGGLGDDSIFGFRGADTLNGGEGIDVLIGHEGNDTLDLRDTTVVPTGAEGEYAIGGSGNDTIYADDGQIDAISCGSGKKDTVAYDQYDLFVDPTTAELVSSPTADCEKATLVMR